MRPIGGPYGTRYSRNSRRQRAVYRRRRLTVLGVFVLVVALVVVFTSGGGGKGSVQGRKAGRSAAATAAKPPAKTNLTQATIPAIEAGLLPWKLVNPLSRMVLFPGSGPNLLIAGGLTESQSSAKGVYSLDTATGALKFVGNLPSPVHDAAGAVVAGQDVVFGGGAPTTFATVQGFSASTAGGQALGNLPAPRSDLAAATIGGTTYIVGGYDGTNPDAAVLATTDGKTYTTVANLPVPVRYAAVAAAGSYIYVFGGQTIGGSSPPTDDIQRIDPGAHKATIVGHLPLPLEAASAVTLSGHIYLAGGDTLTSSASATGNTPAGEGTTQLDGWGMATSAGSGFQGLTTSGAIWAFDPAGGKVLNAGRLQVPVSHAGALVVGGRAWLVGGESSGTQLGTVQVMSTNAGFGAAGQPGAGTPYYGSKLLVADRGNNRLLLFNSALQLKWTYPNSTSPPDPLGFYFPDDAFFINHGTAILSNQEQNNTIVQIAYPSGKIIWSYGHPKQASPAAGYLHEPDDAYLLRNGQITVADAYNCRVLVINQNGTVAGQIGTNGVCTHNPPTSIGTPNGDTPLWNGDLLVSEINGSWVSEWTTSGKYVWSVQLPIAYPSDPQQIGASATNNNNRYLIADYSSPGQVLQFTRQGQILSRYDVGSGPGMLNHPSLAELLPSGVYLINDDYNDRMVAIDPVTGALVWQYGITGHAGSAPGMLNTPDGFDLLGPGGSTPTHPQTG